VSFLTVACGLSGTCAVVNRQWKHPEAEIWLLRSMVSTSPSDRFQDVRAVLAALMKLPVPATRDRAGDSVQCLPWS